MELDVARIEKYVRNKYPKVFKNEPLTITENQSFYLIKRNFFSNYILYTFVV